MTVCKQLLAAVLAGMVSAQPTPAADPDTWLNAADLGASGSAYQTTATVTAGALQITVAEPGDFRAGQGVMLSRALMRYANQTL